MFKMQASTGCKNLHVGMILAAICAVYATGLEAQRRAPAGFTGVRGKKSIPDTAYSETRQQLESDVGKATLTEENVPADKRLPSGFMGMRGKKPLTLDYPEDYYLPEYYKRAPAGFVGMRGKKPTIYDAGRSQYFDGSNAGSKRAPMGFLGMRGKKDDELYAAAYVPEHQYLLKRVPLGFMDNKILTTSSKSFLGTRGKKYPYEFRGKFVGVRGKKGSNRVTAPSYNDNGEYPGNNFEDLGRLAQELDINQLMLLLTENEASGEFDASARNNKVD